MRWLSYTTECSLCEQFISLTPPASACTFSPPLYVFLFSPEPHLPLFLIFPLHLHYLLVHFAFPPLCLVSLISPLFTLSAFASTLILSSTWHFFFFLWWPRSQAVGLYLVRPMIKSAGLTSASDRPIHPTDTPPPPHTGRLNNLCTISNMKEDLLTLQSPPAPFPISLDC